MLLQLLEAGGGYTRDPAVPTLSVTNGAGFERPAGAPDLATVIVQVYEFMRDNTIYFPFNGKYYVFTFWQCFITIVGFWLVVDIVCMGWRLINRNQVVFDGFYED